MAEKKAKAGRLIDWIVLLLVLICLFLIILHIGKGLSNHSGEHTHIKKPVSGHNIEK